jgi:hypothetical protein
MKKIITFLLMLVALMTVASCGAGDKYVGEWITYTVDSNRHIDDKATILKISKNGDNYIIKKSIAHYDRIIKGGLFKKMSCTAAWVIEDLNNEVESATLKDDQLLTVPAMGIGYTYLEKDKVLLDNKNKIVYEKYTKEKFDQYKTEITKHMHERYDDLKFVTEKELQELRMSN